jgi:hypothetical protein
LGFGANPLIFHCHPGLGNRYAPRLEDHPAGSPAIAGHGDGASQLFHQIADHQAAEGGGRACQIILLSPSLETFQICCEIQTLARSGTYPFERVPFFHYIVH